MIIKQHENVYVVDNLYKGVNFMFGRMYAKQNKNWQITSRYE